MLALKLSRHILVVCLAGHFGMQIANAHTTIPFDDDQWEMVARESRIEDHLGKPSLFLKGGHALLSDVQFLNRIIEFDIAFTGERGSMGTIWRVRPEGKAKRLVLNNIANKLLKVICAVVNTQTGFIPDYKPISPVVLNRA